MGRMNDRTANAADLWALRGIKQPIILASTSPRRAAILQEVGCPFEVVPADISEGDYGPWDGGAKLRRIAAGKAEDVSRRNSARAILAADTVVVIGDEVLGKPEDANDARRMLQLLSGRDHEVWTAMCYIPEQPRTPRAALVFTKVTFRSLDASAIEAYISSGEPLDKAGAYGIQGMGGLWVQKLEGCYFNVVGLPLWNCGIY